MSRKGKVLVAMSGGIDSSAACMLLLDMGYEVIGLTMISFDFSTISCNDKYGSCCSFDSIEDAKEIAKKLHFEHHTLNTIKEFEQEVVSNFVDEYVAGRTPNPCVMCNMKVRWDLLIQKADEFGCEYVATGHYAQINKSNGRYYISKGIDENKDQSYFLWGLNQEVLKRTILPLGKYSKKEIREICAKKGFKKMSEKEESMEICFIPDNNYRGFLIKKVENLKENIGEGDFVDKEGNILGKHKGYPFYTIGQRKGLNVAVGYPLYVIEINAKDNIVVLGEKSELNKKVMWVRDFNLMKYDEFTDNYEVITKIRYRNKGSLSHLTKENDKLKIQFDDSVSAIAPGQSAVFYEGNDVVGGGFIA